MFSCGDIVVGSVMYVRFGYAPNSPLSNASDLIFGNISWIAVMRAGKKNGTANVFMAEISMP